MQKKLMPVLTVFISIFIVYNINGMNTNNTTVFVENAPDTTFKANQVTLYFPAEQKVHHTHEKQDIYHYHQNDEAKTLNEELLHHTKSSAWSAYDQVLTSVIATLIIKAGEKTVYAAYNYLYDYIYQDPADLKLAKEALVDASKILQRINLMQNTDKAMIMRLMQGYQNATVRSLEHAVKYAQEYPHDESNNAQLEEVLSNHKTNVCVLQNESCKRFSALLGELAIANSQKYLPSAPSNPQPKMLEKQKQAPFEHIEDITNTNLTKNDVNTNSDENKQFEPKE